LQQAEPEQHALLLRLTSLSILQQHLKTAGPSPN
jgi:hypothetical protein